MPYGTACRTWATRATIPPTMHWLRAVEAAGTLEAQAVMARMRETPINDFFAKDGRIRADGRMVHEMYVIRGEEARRIGAAPGTYYKLRATIPADQAYRPLVAERLPAGAAGLSSEALPAMEVPA